MISATATFAVFKRQTSPAEVRVITILTGLADIRPHDAIDPALPTYEEAVRIATYRGLARQPRIGFLKKFGVAEFVPMRAHCLRISGGTRLVNRCNCIAQLHQTGFPQKPVKEQRWVRINLAAPRQTRQ